MRMSKDYWTVNIPYTIPNGRHDREVRRAMFAKLKAHPLYAQSQSRRNTKADAERIRDIIAKDTGLELEVNETCDLIL